VVGRYKIRLILAPLEFLCSSDNVAKAVVANLRNVDLELIARFAGQL